MPHTLAQEHMGMVDAIRYGTARNQTTLAAAISGIGTTPTVLILTMSGDGVWTISSNLSVPANISLWIPPGVTVFRATGVTLTLLGPLISWQPSWETGPGTTNRVYNEGVYTEFTRLVAYQGVNATRDGINFVAGPSPAAGGSGRQVLVFSNEGEARAGVRFMNGNQDATHSWDIAITSAGGLAFRRPGAGADQMALGTAGFGISNGSAANSPAALLHMIVDNTLKATSAWGTPSDERLKTVHGPFTHGLAKIQSLPQSVEFEWNGKAGTVADGKAHVGRIAQETLLVAPELVTTYQAKLEPDDPEPTELYSTNDSPLLDIIINALKEIGTRLDALEAAGPVATQAQAENGEDDPAPAPRAAPKKARRKSHS